MCATCGCAEVTAVRVIDVRGDSPVEASPHIHDGHTHDGHTHDGHTHDGQNGDAVNGAGLRETGTQTLLLEQRVLAKNDALAQLNRDWLRARGIVAVNLMSSPGSGKTTLLERTVRELQPMAPVCVVEGDQETTFDADRIKAAGAPVVQINTGAGCHLDASMFGTALNTLNPRAGLVLVENVGNLVCPALFDLGEDCRVVIMSVTEGVDKPLKYPQIFASATVIVLNKIDLLPYVDFDVARFERDVALVNQHACILQVSATRGDGLGHWYDWLVNRSSQGFPQATWP